MEEMTDSIDAAVNIIATQGINPKNSEEIANTLKLAKDYIISLTLASEDLEAEYNDLIKELNKQQVELEAAAKDATKTTKSSTKSKE